MKVLLGAAACLAMVTAAAAPASAESSAGTYVVIVDYTADAARFEKLKSLVEGVARASIQEPGCRRFDVVVPAGAAGHLILFEVFDDVAAFAAHVASAPFKQFVVDSGSLGATRTASPGAMVLSLHNP